MKTKKLTLTPVIAAIAVIIVLGIAFMLPKGVKNNVPTPYTEKLEPIPQLQSVKYVTKDLGNGWVRVISENYKVQFDAPKELTIETSQSFDKTYPQFESAQLTLIPQDSTSNVNLHSGVGFLIKSDSQNLKNLVEQQLKDMVAKKNINSYTKVESAIVGNAKGYSYTYTGGGDGGGTVFVYSIPTNSNYYIQFSFSRAFGGSGVGGGNMTTSDKAIMQKIVSSFKISN